MTKVSYICPTPDLGAATGQASPFFPRYLTAIRIVSKALINSIGVVSGALGVVQFPMDHFSEPNKVGQASIKIGVGLDPGYHLRNEGSDLPDVRLFSEAGQFLGMAVDSGSVDEGGFGEVKVQIARTGNGKQPTYALFSASDAAICIAYASMTWPSGDRYAFDGDWGKACGNSWYYSNHYLTPAKKSPTCTWIDPVNAHMLNLFALPDRIQQSINHCWARVMNTKRNPEHSSFTGLSSRLLKLVLLPLTPSQT